MARSSISQQELAMTGIRTQILPFASPALYPKGRKREKCHSLLVPVPLCLGLQTPYAIWDYL